MIIPGDKGPTATEEGLFAMSTLRSKADLDGVLDNRAEVVASDSEAEEEGEDKRSRKMVQRFDRGEKGRINQDGLWYEEHDLSGDEGDENDDSDNGEKAAEDESDDDDDDEEDGGEIVDESEEESQNPLIASLSEASEESKRARKADLWFQKLGDLDSDSDLEEAELNRLVMKKGASLKQKKMVEEEPKESGYTSDSDNEEEGAENVAKKAAENKETVEESSDSDSDDDSSSEEEEETRTDGGGFEIVSQQKKRKPLSAEELAIGENMVASKKRKRDLMDAGWNRFMTDDAGLPDWFVKEEEMHMRRQVELDPATVEKYREREKELNVKTIKKVVEAKARRKRRVAKQMDKARKKASALMDNEDVGNREKANEIRKMYKKAAAAGKKKEVKYVVAKKHQAGKRASRPAGTKGPYKQVNRSFFKHFSLN